MATANLYGQFPARPYPDKQPPSVWRDQIAPTQQQRLLADDLEAGKRVSSVLIGVVAAGLVLMAATVWFCL